MGGRNISFGAPVFDFDEFRKTPNAGEFVRKAYNAAVKKIAREVEGRENGSVPADLGSYEMIVARSLKFTRADIVRWLNERDWSKIAALKEPERVRASMENWLPTLAGRVNYLQERPSNNIALKIVATLAGKPDPVADFLFIVLTVAREPKESCLLLL
jgi:hypothetical protein